MVCATSSAAPKIIIAAAVIIKNRRDNRRSGCARWVSNTIAPNNPPIITAWISLSMFGMAGSSSAPSGSEHNVAYSTTAKVKADGQYRLINVSGLFICQFVNIISFRRFADFLGLRSFAWLFLFNIGNTAVLSVSDGYFDALRHTVALRCLPTRAICISAASFQRHRHCYCTDNDRRYT